MESVNLEVGGYRRNCNRREWKALALKLAATVKDAIAGNGKTLASKWAATVGTAIAGNGKR